MFSDVVVGVSPGSLDTAAAVNAIGPTGCACAGSRIWLVTAQGAARAHFNDASFYRASVEQARSDRSRDCAQYRQDFVSGLRHALDFDDHVTRIAMRLQEFCDDVQPA